MTNQGLKQYIPFVDAISKTFGENCEVVLHDVTNPAESIIKIANGHVTGRVEGGPLTDLGLHLLEKARKHTINDLLIGYQTVTKQGIVLKSTTVFIRDRKGKIIGSLCINVDITPYLAAQSSLDSMCKTFKLGNEADNGGDKSPEKFEANVDVLIGELLQQTLNKIGKPPGYMQKEDKLRIIRDLKDKGLFLIKGATKRVSKELNVSVPTIYKYLEEASD